MNLRDDSCIGDVGVVEEEGFDLGRSNLVAFVFDDFFETINDEELIIFIDEPYISRV